jgi:hypothetical protein
MSAPIGSRLKPRQFSLRELLVLITFASVSLAMLRLEPISGSCAAILAGITLVRMRAERLVYARAGRSMTLWNVVTSAMVSLAAVVVAICVGMLCGMAINAIGSVLMICFVYPTAGLLRNATIAAPVCTMLVVVFEVIAVLSIPVSGLAGFIWFLCFTWPIKPQESDAFQPARPI